MGIFILLRQNWYVPAARIQISKNGVVYLTGSPPGTILLFFASVFPCLVPRSSCIVSFASTNDPHPTNDPLATISKGFLYLVQLPLELATCWIHARHDYRTVVDVGARAGGPHEELENRKKGKKRRVPCLRDITVSKLPRLKRMHTPPVPDSESDVLALTRIDTPLLSQTCTIISIGTGDAAKQGHSPACHPARSSPVCYPPRSRYPIRSSPAYCPTGS